MAGNYDKFTPVIQLDEITTAEEEMLSNLVALADSASGEFLQMIGGQVVNTQLNIGIENGGTGLTSLEPYSLLAGGTTETGSLQQIYGQGEEGQVLTSNGESNLPTWQSLKQRVYGCIPSGDKNGINQSYLLPEIPREGSVAVFLNGQRMAETEDYSISGIEITMGYALESNEILLVDYDKLN